VCVRVRATYTVDRNTKTALTGYRSLQTDRQTDRYDILREQCVILWYPEHRNAEAVKFRQGASLYLSLPARYWPARTIPLYVYPLSQHHSFHPEDGGSTILRNTGILHQWAVS